MAGSILIDPVAVIIGISAIGALRQASRYGLLINMPVELLSIINRPNQPNSNKPLIAWYRAHGHCSHGHPFWQNYAS
jgi:hypothetical protein